MRGIKVKALRKKYIEWLTSVMPHIPKDHKPISFRVWRRRAVRA